MPREVTDGEGIIWTCIQAYAGLQDQKEKKVDSDTAARVEGQKDRYHVVCTPSGGAQSVRVELVGDWEDALSDEDLLREIEAKQQ